MRVTMLLADHAVVAEGKLYINGGGWSVTGPAPTPSAIALLIQVPWDQTETQHEMRLECIDADGVPVMVDGPGASEPLAIQGQFEVGRPPDLRLGTPMDIPIAINLGPTAFAPDSRYTWQLYIDGETSEEWYVSFSTRPDGSGDE